MTAHEWRIAGAAFGLAMLANVAGLQWLYGIRNLPETTASYQLRAHQERRAVLRACRERQVSTAATHATLLQTQSLMTKILATVPPGWHEQMSTQLDRLEECACPTSTTIPDGS